MAKPLRETTIPGGLRVACVRPYEVGLIQGEMPGYFRHGIDVRDGDVVFDVGANIGLFGLWVLQMGHRDVSVYSFEPIPRTFQALQANAQRHGGERWRVFNCGLSNRAGSASFGYHAHATLWSSPYPDNSPEEWELLRGAMLRNLDAYPPTIRWLRWLPGPLRAPLLNWGLRRAFHYRAVQCALRTLSDVVQSERVTRIDLLKIDVQRGEMDVLEGIADDDWARIGQVVIEIHDLNEGRVERACALLKRHGFDALAQEQEPMLRGTDIYNLFARRSNWRQTRPATIDTSARTAHAA